MTEPSCLKDLEENSFDIYCKVSSIILKLLDNIIKEPTNPKYRRLRIGNATVSGTLLPAIGAMECLFYIGFKEDGDAIMLPNNIPIRDLQIFRNQLLSRKAVHEKRVSEASKNTSKPSATGIAGPSEQQQQSKPLQNNATNQPSSCNTKSEQLSIAADRNSEANQSPLPTASISNQAISQREITVPSSEESKDKMKHKLEGTDLLEKIDTIFHKMSRYEDKKLLAKALAIIPRQELSVKVAKQLEDPNNQMNPQLHTQELLLTELLKWFKTSFFSWVDKPQCPSCEGPTEYVSQSPSFDESMSRIEEYKCLKCGIEVPFPRYEDLDILLQSRRGRCGEWANVFTLLCRALEWDVRYVYDVTDHVWTEVYSIRQKRWLHCDPCEAALDTPLMYEKGWGKKLSYVIAFSLEEVQDVTWRYSSQHQEICSRRKTISEQELIDKILSLTRKRLSSLPPERTQFLLRRRVEELVEFLSPPEATEEYGGRTSGSKEWREARGESKTVIQKPMYVWKPSPASIKNLKFQVEYSTTLDKYVETSTNREVSGWNRGVYSAEAIFRKEELDWKTVYLARTEGSAVGKIEWKFNFESCGAAVSQIQVRCPFTVYENGTVQWFLCDENNCQKIPDGKEFITQASPGVTEFTLRSELGNGKGNLAWQHAQLFRQSTDSRDFIFSIIFTLKPLEGNHS